MSQRIEIYKELRDELKASLETQYTYNMGFGNVQDAYNIFLRMMEFGFISFDDPRANPRTKMFKVDGYPIDCADPANWAMRDVRRGAGSNYAPKPLFGEFNYQFAMLEEIIPHWGKRLENGYEGDVFMDVLPSKVVVRMITSKKSIKDAFSNINDICKENGVKAGDMSDILKEALLGMAVVYEISMTGNVMNGFRVMGYVVYRVTDDGSAYNCFTFVRYPAMAKMWLNVTYFQSDIERVAHENLCRAIPVANLHQVIKPDKALEIQSNMIRASNSKGAPPKKLVTA